MVAQVASETRCEPGGIDTQNSLRLEYQGRTNMVLTYHDGMVLAL